MIATIKVIDEDIITGSTAKCKLCPLALAINRVLKPHLQSSIRYNDMEIVEREFGMSIATIMLPTIASDFVAGFDAEPLASQPFEFTLDIPQSLLA